MHDVILNVKPDKYFGVTNIWLTATNLHKFSERFSRYFFDFVHVLIACPVILLFVFCHV